MALQAKQIEKILILGPAQTPQGCSRPPGALQEPRGGSPPPPGSLQLRPESCRTSQEGTPREGRRPGFLVPGPAAPPEGIPVLQALGWVLPGRQGPLCPIPTPKGRRRPPHRSKEPHGARGGASGLPFVPPPNRISSIRLGKKNRRFAGPRPSCRFLNLRQLEGHQRVPAGSLSGTARNRWSSSTDLPPSRRRLRPDLQIPDRGEGEIEPHRLAHLRQASVSSSAEARSRGPSGSASIVGRTGTCGHPGTTRRPGNPPSSSTSILPHHPAEEQVRNVCRRFPEGWGSRGPSRPDRWGQDRKSFQSSAGPPIPAPPRNAPLI